MKFWSFVLSAGVLLAAMAVSSALIAGFLGFLHPALDSFSHFRLHLAVLLGLCAVLFLITGFNWNALVAALFAGASFVSTMATPLFGPTAAQALPGDDARPVYSLLQINLRWNHPDPDRVIALVRDVRPDILTLDEVSPMWASKLSALSEDYPHRIVCNPRSFGSAILSRRPIHAQSGKSCHERGAFAVGVVDLEGQQVEIGAIHLRWPWPYGQARQIDRLTPALRNFGETAIIAGDFNAATWSHAVRRVAGAAGMEIARGVGPTWIDYKFPRSMLWAGLPIDNVMYKGVVLRDARTLADVGSDHWPILMRFSLAGSRALHAAR